MSDARAATTAEMMRETPREERRRDGVPVPEALVAQFREAGRASVPFVRAGGQ